VPRQPVQPRANLAQRPYGHLAGRFVSIFERYWWQILLGGSLIILQGLLISALILRCARAG
jgi:hypothetical protein